MNLELMETENCRLLSFPRFWGEELATSLMEWENLARRIPGLKTYDDEILLYFFISPLDENFKKTPFWFSRRVIGFIPEADEYKVTDQDKGHGWQGEEFDLILFDQLLEKAKSLFTEANEKGLDVAATWRVRLKLISLCQKAQIQCFHEK